jgi:hypothetical protein
MGIGASLRVPQMVGFRSQSKMAVGVNSVGSVPHRHILQRLHNPWAPHVSLKLSLSARFQIATLMIDRLFSDSLVACTNI